MKQSEIAKYRLINQQIAETKLKTASEIVGWLCAVQAQEYNQSKWALGLRLSHLTDSDIEKNFTEGKILRTHILRPTWHFVTAEDIRWLLTISAPRVNAANAFMYRKLELDGKIFNRSNNKIAKALEGGKQLTREELRLVLEKNKIIAEGHRLSYIMMRAELDGVICSGAKQGNQFTYALLDERVPAVETKNRNDALSELTERFFTSRGPATLKDFSTWSGLTLTEARNGIEMVKQHFIQEEIEKETYYFSSEISLAKKQFNEIHLLPIYDEFIMGYKNRNAILQYTNSIKPKPVFSFDCTIIYEGQIIGTWRRTIKQKCIYIEYALFKPFNKIQKIEFQKALLRFKEFTGLEIVIKSDQEKSIIL